MKYHSILALAAALGIIVMACPSYAQTSSSNDPTESTNLPTLPSLNTNPPDAMEDYYPGQQPWNPEALENLRSYNAPQREQTEDNRDATNSQTTQSTTVGR
jgi:hypothetical protein